jgi:hypothetical protein
MDEIRSGERGEVQSQSASRTRYLIGTIHAHRPRTVKDSLSKVDRFTQFWRGAKDIEGKSDIALSNLSTRRDVEQVCYI